MSSRATISQTSIANWPIERLYGANSTVSSAIAVAAPLPSAELLKRWLRSIHGIDESRWWKRSLQSGLVQTVLIAPGSAIRSLGLQRDVINIKAFSEQFGCFLANLIRVRRVPEHEMD